MVYVVNKTRRTSYSRNRESAVGIVFGEGDKYSENVKCDILLRNYGRDTIGTGLALTFNTEKYNRRTANPIRNMLLEEEYVIQKVNHLAEYLLIDLIKISFLVTCLVLQKQTKVVILKYHLIQAILIGFM
jgi:hypothetical protein